MKGGFDGGLESSLELGMYLLKEGEKRGGVLLAAKRAITSICRSAERKNIPGMMSEAFASDSDLYRNE